MIVCLCHGVCERRLEALAQSGANTLEHIERLCGAGGDCGTCRPDVEAIIERTMATPATAAASAPASRMLLPVLNASR